MAECERCGCHMKDDTANQRLQRGRDLWGCGQCKAGKQTKVRTAYGVCTPHQGEFDENDRPLTKNGEFYRAGFRLCGHSDCVDLDHIRASEEANA
jgi:ABC-type transport system involved in cytochrome c biogenesis ATPase subunit